MVKKRKKRIVKKVIKKAKMSADLGKPDKKVNKLIVTKYPPLTSIEAAKKTRAEQNALNRARSKAMENRVAKVLGGRRVLMSGAAAAYKGDVEVRFKNNPSGYIVECKLSSQSKEKEPYIILKYYWFPKMHQEAINMGSKFSILIINFLGNTRDFVFVRTDIIEKLIHKYDIPYAAVLLNSITELQTYDIRTNLKGRVLSMYLLMRSAIEDRMKNTKVMKLIISDGEYLVMHIDTWADMVKEL